MFIQSCISCETFICVRRNKIEPYYHYPSMPFDYIQYYTSLLIRMKTEAQIVCSHTETNGELCEDDGVSIGQPFVIIIQTCLITSDGVLVLNYPSYNNYIIQQERIYTGHTDSNTSDEEFSHLVLFILLK
jgi:hypothetical protein